eukprot:gene22783-biopygen23766
MATGRRASPGPPGPLHRGGPSARCRAGYCAPGGGPGDATQGPTLGAEGRGQAEVATPLESGSVLADEQRKGKGARERTVEWSQKNSDILWHKGCGAPLGGACFPHSRLGSNGLSARRTRPAIGMHLPGSGVGVLVNSSGFWAPAVCRRIWTAALSRRPGRLRFPGVMCVCGPLAKTARYRDTSPWGWDRGPGQGVGAPRPGHWGNPGSRPIWGGGLQAQVNGGGYKTGGTTDTTLELPAAEGGEVVPVAAPLAPPVRNGVELRGPEFPLGRLFLVAPLAPLCHLRGRGVGFSRACAVVARAWPGHWCPRARALVHPGQKFWCTQARGFGAPRPEVLVHPGQKFWCTQARGFGVSELRGRKV